MKNLLLWFFALLFCSPVLAVYDILLENDTPYNLLVNTGAYDDLSHNIYDGWHERIIEPYGRAQVQWFNFNEGIKAGKIYTFFVEVTRLTEQKEHKIVFTTSIKGTRIGSTISEIKVLSSGEAAPLFFSEPTPYFSVLRSIVMPNVLGDQKSVILRADAIKYSVPNPHKNIQLTDAIAYVISEIQPQYSYSHDKNELSLVTYNTQLWPLYGRLGGIIMNKPEVRVLQIAKKLGNYDVVSFQEVFARDHRASLTEALKENYPFHLEPAMNRKPLSSGVVLYSRWPIVNHDTLIYEACAGIDCGATKGVGYIEIKKYGIPYHIFSTHLQAGLKSVKVKEVRKKQLQELQAFITSKNIPNNEAIILTGDFNIDAYTCFISNECGEFVDLVQGLDLVYQPHENRTIVPFTVNNSINWMGTEQMKAILDYIMPIKNHRIIQSYQSRILVLRSDDDSELFSGTPYGDTDLSDHFTLEAKIRYKEDYQ